MLFTGNVVMAQSNYQGGVVVSAFEFGPLDMLSLSQHNGTFSTARATAMGGAFTALGGDLASMSINPAGIGMYRGSTFGFTPAMNFSGSDNLFSPNIINNNRFSVNNLGTVINTYLGSGKTTAFNFGFSYNKLADFNYSYEVNPSMGSHSLADLMSFHLNGLYQYLAGNGWDGISQKWLKSDPFLNTSLSLAEWGAILGYQTGLVTSMKPGDENWAMYGVNGIDLNAKVSPHMKVVNKGSVGEYNMTGSLNIENKLYLGLGITFQDIYLSRRIYYSEDYVDNSGDASGVKYLDRMKYDQSVRMSGFGMNFKIGAIYRPIPELRIGLAVHTPTWTTVTHEYFASMETFFVDNSYARSETLLNYYDMSYNSPPRLMAGISYTLGEYAAFSFDYERVWYNGMRLTGEDAYVRQGYKDEVTDLYKASNNFKAGIEVKPIPEIALRAGYAYYGTPMRYADTADNRYSKPVVKQTQNISAGIGFRLGYNVMLDLAYVYSIDKYCNFDVFYYQGQLLKGTSDGDGEIIHTNPDNPLTTEGGPIGDLKVNRHTALISLSFLF